MPIHATAVIDKQAQIDSSADIGPFVVIEGQVKIGAGAKIFPNAYISGWTEIGERCEIHPGAVVGHYPQDFHFKGERSYCKIGAGTIIRECASIHRGTQPESWTILGENCFLLAYAHVAHNCELGSGVKLYNNGTLAGHVIVGDNAIISAYTMIHQFARIGEFVMIGGGSRITKDIPPYMKAWREGTILGYNGIGLKRSGIFSSDDVNEARTGYKMLFRSELPMSKAIEEYSKVASGPVGRRLLEFVRGPSRLGIGTGRGAEAANEDALEEAEA
ncbi:MAG: acyl-ACP--UDP-N-acetylglucosamine O-acyltransferase [Planctomycetes bacterium]|nr:acyl-ACP--UDP-N-acetylglucosamine O-acyltransferase [Planctomycetota bacterium]